MQFLLMPKPTHNVLVNTTLPNLLNSGNLFAHNLAQTQDHGGGALPSTLTVQHTQEETVYMHAIIYSSTVIAQHPLKSIHNNMSTKHKGLYMHANGCGI